MVINTRPANQSQELSELLGQAGFGTLDIPTVAITSDEAGLSKLLKLQPAHYTGIFLSSINGLRHLTTGLQPEQVKLWLTKPFYLVGGKSADPVAKLGGHVAFFPKEASVDGFLKEYLPPSDKGMTRSDMSERWLHPCSSLTRLDPAAFALKKIAVENISVYSPSLPPDAIHTLATEGAYADAVIFCSGSAVANFFKAAPTLASRLGSKGALQAISIGPSTSKVLTEQGIKNFTEAKAADNPSLVAALQSVFR